MGQTPLFEWSILLIERRHWTIKRECVSTTKTQSKQSHLAVEKQKFLIELIFCYKKECLTFRSMNYVHSHAIFTVERVGHILNIRTS